MESFTSEARTPFRVYSTSQFKRDGNGLFARSLARKSDERREEEEEETGAPQGRQRKTKETLHPEDVCIFPTVNYRFFIRRVAGLR